MMQFQAIDWLAHRGKTDACSSILMVAAKTSLTFLAGMIVSSVLYLWVPFRDPPDVVGPSLMRGYSEAAEQWALYVFWWTAVATVCVLERIRPNWSARWASWVGGLGLLWLVHLPLVMRKQQVIVAFLVAWTAAFLCGGYASSRLKRGFGRGSWPWCGMLLWGLGYHGTLVECFSNSSLGLRIGGALIIVWLCWQRWGVSLKRELSGQIRLAQMATIALIVLMLAAMRSASFHDLWMGVSAAVVYCLGTLTARDERSKLSHPAWIVCVGTMAVTAYYLSNMNGVQSQIQRGLGGMGLGVVLHWAFCERWGPFKDLSCARWSFAKRPWIWMLLIGCGATELVFKRPALGGLIAVSLCLFVVLWKCPSRRTRVSTSVWMTLLLTAAVMPVFGILRLDTFHDGYNLSCAWEFENGRELYTELVPIRSFQFFVTWLSRRCLPHTIEAYLWTFSVLQVLPMLGVFGLSQVWTRRCLPWSLATVVLVLALTDLDSRQGTHLLLAVAALIAFRRTEQWMWPVLASCGLVAGFCGFDTLCPFTVALTLTMFFVPNAGRESPLVRATTRFGRAMFAGVICVAPFTLVMAAWQGPRAAVEHWQILLDFAGHFNVFSGLPVNWRFPWSRFYIGFGFVVLAAWVAAGISNWERTIVWKRRGWLFLMIQFGFLLHRGVGRSDEAHLRDVMIPGLALTSLLLFDLLHRLRGAFAQPALLRPTRVAWCIVLFLLARGRFPLLALEPTVFSEVATVLRGEGLTKSGEDPFVQKHVGLGETIWPIENAASNYSNRRHNATRHPLAHIICSPAEQRRAVSDLLRHSPQLIEWPTRENTDRRLPQFVKTLNASNFATISTTFSHDGIAASLRYYLISHAILPKYRPASEEGFIELAPPEWLGLERLPDHMNEKLECQQLPLAWGERRLSDLSRSTHARWTVPILAERRIDASQKKNTPLNHWEGKFSFTPRQFNYLILTFATTGEPDQDAGPVASLEYTPTDWDDQTLLLTFDCVADGRERTYVLPVGCSPGWLWCQNVNGLRLTAPVNCHLSQPNGVLWRVDELNRP